MEVYHVSFPGLGINDLAIDRIAFSFEIGGKEFSIYWYGIIIAFAFLLCIFLATRQAPKYGLKSDDVIDTLLWVIIAGLVGARLYYVAFAWDSFKDDWTKIFQMRNGGLAFYGGLIGGALAVILSAKIKKINLMRYVDFFAVYVPLGQAIGRWGNFVNQEAFGTNTDLPWGMWSEKTYEYLNQFGQTYAPMSPVHPTFLYEFLANMGIFFILYIMRKKNKKNGAVLSMYLFFYGIVRFLVEGIRTDSLYIGGSDIRISQALSLLFVIAAVLIRWLSMKSVFGTVSETATIASDDALSEKRTADSSAAQHDGAAMDAQTEEQTAAEIVNDKTADETGEKKSDSEE